MENKLTKEEVLHVAHLARVLVTEEDIIKYQYQLKELLDDVEKINDVANYDEEMMFCSAREETVPRLDTESDIVDFEVVKNNIPRKNGKFVEVPVMISE